MDYFNILYRKALSLESWGFVVRILGWGVALICFIVGIVLASDFGMGIYFVVGLVLAAITVVGASFMGLLLEVIGMTARATVDSGTSKPNHEPAVDMKNIISAIKTKAAEPSTPEKAPNSGEIKFASNSQPDSPWICLYCGKNNLACDNICNNCGQKKAE